MSDELSIEKPVLDVENSEKKDLPDEVPNVFNAKEENELDPLIKDIDILVTINDIKGAKKLYTELKKKYDALSDEKKKEHFIKVEKVYKKIENYNSFGAKIKRMFR